MTSSYPGELGTAAFGNPNGEAAEIRSEDLATLLFIRHFEVALLGLFSQGLVNGTTHTCIGQEEIAVAMAPLLADDYVLGNHRSHGHYLARFDDAHGLLAEILGKEGGVCNGVGGSQNILRGDYISTGVQGQSVPIAAGIALGFQNTGKQRLACAFIGDGTWGEGAVYEGLNMAVLWHLPLVLIVENNGIAQSTRTENQMAGDIAGRAAAFGARYCTINSDINAMRATTAPLLAKVRARGEPLVLEVRTQRLGPHSKGDDYRPAEEVERGRVADWYFRYRRSDQQRFDSIEAAQGERIAQVVEDVRRRQPSVWKGDTSA